jgi:hypothetical protein
MHQSIGPEVSEQTLKIELTESELRYLVGVGFGALSYIPLDAMSTYTNFNKDQILEFSKKIRAEMDAAGISM